MFNFFDSHCSNVQCYTTFLFCFPIFAENIWALRVPPVLTLPFSSQGPLTPVPPLLGSLSQKCCSRAGLQLPTALPCPGPWWAGLTCGTMGENNAQGLGCPCVTWLPCSWLRMGWTLAPWPPQGSMCCCWPLPCSLRESVLCCSIVYINIPPSSFPLQY